MPTQKHETMVMEPQAPASGELLWDEGGFLAHLLSHSESGSLSFTSSLTSRERVSGKSWSPGSPEARKQRKRKKMTETAPNQAWP